MPTAYETEVLADAPRLWWRMEDNLAPPYVDRAYDRSGNGRHGQYVGAPPVIGGALLLESGENARSFDGAAQYVQHGSYSPFTVGGDCAVEAWVLRGSQATNDAICGGIGGAATAVLRLNSGGDTMAWFPQASASATWAGCGVGTGAWHHVVLSFDNAGNLATLYVDAASKGAVAMTDDFGAGMTGFIAGAWNQTLTLKDPWLGRLDEVAVYGATLSATRVLAHFNAGGAGNAPRC